jgi:site-specific DNA recombinase
MEVRRMEKTHQKLLVGYCRVSTDNQKEEGTIEIQRHALREYAEKQGHELLAIFCDEGVSGGLEDRPGLSGLFDYLEAQADVAGVLIFKLDRLARDLYIQEHLIKKLEGLKKELVSIKEPDLDSKDPMRKAFRQFMGIVAELEKAFIAMRLSGGRIHKARKGGYAGGRAALGYIVKDKALSIDETGAEIVRTIFDMNREGMSLRAIARVLNGRGIPTARGGRWYAGTVRYMLSNSLYGGIYGYKGETANREDLAIM